MVNYSFDLISKHHTLVELLRWRADCQSNQRAYTYLVDGETQELSLTYAELDQQACAISALLKTRGLTRGDRVLLCYPPGLEYIAAFFGCLYAEVIAIPCKPPHRNRPDDHLQSIVADAQVSGVFTTQQIASNMRKQCAHIPNPEFLQWVLTDDSINDLTAEWTFELSAQSDTVAFLQYTSGSTGAPKGVMLTHKNLLWNLALIHQCFEVTPESQGVIWLPPYHDMGLIGGILEPLYGGFPVTLMAPAAFLQSPVRWLRAISRYHATISGGPNFAYDYCVRKITPEDRASLDLSAWQVAFNGAEPIRAITLERFLKTFKPCGFRQEAFYPCYGLAEATLLVTGGKKTLSPVVRTFQKTAILKHNVLIEASSKDEDAQTFVSCGQVLPDQEVVVVHPTSLTTCPSGHIGEIWIAGSGVAQGYWNHPQEPDHTFDAYLPDPERGPFMRTGDLGAFHNGELFVTGRLKDLIIIRGCNHHPQDIELTVEQSHAALQPGGGAAFSVDAHHEERLVVVQEIMRTRQSLNIDEIVSAIRQAVAKNHSLEAYAVILVKPYSLPKTPSGKIQRYACREKFLSSDLEIVAESILETSLTEASPSFDDADNFILKALNAITDPTARHSLLSLYLQEQIAREIGRDASQLDPQRPLSEFGLDSLKAIALQHGIEGNLGILLPIAHILEGPSISQIASHVLAEMDASTPLETLAPVQAEFTEYPLAFGQQSLWFLHQFAPEQARAAYNIARAVRIRGNLDVTALEETFQTLLDRHLALRTTFPASSGEPVQQINKDMGVYFRKEDMSDRSATWLSERLVEEASRPFDLEQDPILRIHLFTRSADEYILLLTMHHIAIDFWSAEILMNEFSAMYSAKQAGIARVWPPLQLTYADYVRWQFNMLTGSEGERLWAYWRKQLRGDLPVLNLPTDRPRPALQTYSGAMHRFRLDKTLTTQLKMLAKTEGVTLYMVLLASFYVLLHRYTAQEDILVGSPSAGRTRSEFKNIVGYFMTPLVLRTNLSGNPTFTSFLHQVRQTVLGALRHQDYPSHLLSERLHASRDFSHTPLFQVMFILNKLHRVDAQWGTLFAQGQSKRVVTLAGLELENLPLEQRTARFDLELEMNDLGDSLPASFHYNTDLFDTTTIARMVTHFQTLLKNIVVNSDQRLSQLSLLTDAEQNQALFEWNETSADYPSRQCIPDLFEAQVARTPEAIAVSCGEQSLTYRELNGHANRLAHYLQRLGVGPEVSVGIWMERSLDMIVSVLAVLKAGGAYVPLDPSYPSERLAFIVKDCGMQLLLMQSQMCHDLPEQNTRVVCVDVAHKDFAQESQQNPVSARTPENLAYVLYTSGSTGQPKGVMIQHHALTNYVLNASEEYAIHPSDRVLQFASLCFDTSAEEIYPCLICGARLFLRTESMLDTVATFLQTCCDWNITVLNLPTAYWHELAAGIDVQALEFPLSIRLVIIGGEKASSEHLLTWRRCVDQRARLVNTYGPTETTIVATRYDLSGSAETADRWQEVPIGRALRNAQVYALDQYLQPSPVGIPGELYIGGSGLARGYLNQPALTSEKFIPHPFSDKPGDRLYKTGDLCRYLPDGNLEFLGRVDYQVKIRGFRIELGEIEAVLGQHPAITHTMVIDREDEPGKKRLVAYIVSQETAPPTISELHRFLKAKLPEYMVPSAFVVLDAFPLTPSGKLDRQALPAPDEVRPDLAETFVAPRTPVEEMITEICAELLDFEQFGVYDDFFELGGHSLLATQLISRLREVFQVEIPLQSLFERPTVADLAEEIEIARRTPGLQLPPIQIAPRDQDLPLSYAQEAIWFLNQLDPHSVSYHVPRAIRIKGSLHVNVLEQAFNELVCRHEILRTSFPDVNGRPTQIIHTSQTIPLKMIDLRELSPNRQEDRIRQLIIAEGQRPFDLAHDQLMRVTLLQLNQEEHVLILTEHHLVHDGWTQGVVIHDLLALYHAYSLGSPSPLPALAIQYADYAYWQRQWLQGDVLEKLLSFWKEELAEASTVLELPADHPRPNVQSFRGDEQTLTLPADLAESLRAFSRNEGVTLFMTMLSGFYMLLYRYSGQADLCVGSVIANRRLREMEGLLGMMLNTIVLRGNLTGNPSIREILRRVREMCLRVYPHQDLPFEKLVEAIQPERNLSYNPLFQVMFAFQDTPTPELELPGLQLSLMPSHNRSAKFDLNMIVLARAEQLITQRSKTQNANELTILLEYNSDIFDTETISRMLRHFQTILEGMAADPDQRLSDLPLLTEVEQHQLLVEWNNTFVDFPRNRSFSQAFEKQVEQSPDTIAAICNGISLTYRELNQQADELASILVEHHVEPETIVALLAERSLDFLIAMLAVFKAGGAYLPLDPRHPPHRLRQVLTQSRCPLVLAADAFRSVLSDALRDPEIENPPLVLPLSPRLPQKDVEKMPSGGRNTVDLSALPFALSLSKGLSAGGSTSSPRTEDLKSTVLPRGCTPQHLAYVIYTSGSTGVPKGAMVEQRGMLNHLYAKIRDLQITEADVVAQTAPQCFDISVWQFLAPLLVGGTVHIFPDEIAHNPVRLLQAVSSQQITILETVPSLLRAMLEQVSLADPADFPLTSLRWFVPTGEALPPELARQWLLYYPHIPLINAYGPTECSDDVTHYPFAHFPAAENMRISIGRPIANLRMYILDSQFQPVPIGVAGELYVGGAGVGRGYLHEPKKTAASFLPDPFSSEPGARLYKTGDLARYLPDGNIDFLGRCDHQVKIRGFRIELGEIETVLAQHAMVKETAVLAREDIPGEQRLVAYVVVNGGQEFHSAELRVFLQERLPEYMIPSAFVMLERLPLTPNGKIDRQALPASDGARTDSEAMFVAPRTPMEQQLAEVWRQLLGVEKIGVHENFFELGGHSLLAIQLGSQVLSIFQVELPLHKIFEAPTIAKLSVAVLQHQAEQASSDDLDFMLRQLEQCSDDKLQTMFANHP